LIAAGRAILAMLGHPFQGGLVPLFQTTWGEVLPRRIAHDPVEFHAVHRRLPRRGPFEEVPLENVLIEDGRDAEIGVFLEVGRVDVVEKGQRQAELSHAAGVRVLVHAEDVLFEQRPQLRRGKMVPPSPGQLTFREPAIALDEERPRSAGGVEDLHPGLQAAEIAAAAGSRVEVMTPDRVFAPDIMAMNLVPYMRSLQDKDVTFTVTRRLLDVRREGNKLVAVIGTDYSSHSHEAQYDQVVVNYGTLPLDDLYLELRPQSSNLGEVDYDALIAGQPQAVRRNAAGAFQLFRIGDAVSARNTHAAIYDALRLVKDI